ncbi:MAG: hypothetical protein WC343_11500 [Bacilli bacterium]|jgi:hypothetical protein
MFKKGEEGIFILELKGNNYKLFDDDDYKKLILFLTNPDEMEELELKIDESIVETEDIIRCNLYKNFIDEFISIKKEINLKSEELAKNDSDKGTEEHKTQESEPDLF